MASEPDLYLILGVAEDATPSEIRSAYRCAARAHHPDLHPVDPGAADRFKQARHAYEVLGDPTRRAAYRRPGVHSHPATAGNGLDAFHPTYDRAAPAFELTPELVEALVHLRTMLWRARFERRLRRISRILESW